MLIQPNHRNMPPSQLIQNPLIPSTLTGSVSANSPNDFQIDLRSFSRSTANISLTNLLGDADLQVFREPTTAAGTRTLVKESKNSGRLSETVLLGLSDLPPGIYTIEVTMGTSTPSTTSSVNYSLNVAVNADANLSNIWWRNQTDANTAIWQMNGTVPTGATTYALGKEWQLQGVADLNGDGEEDLLWRDMTTGSIAYWIFKGGQRADSESGLTYNTPISLDWQITAVKDLNADGMADLVWSNAKAGQVGFWTLKDGKYVSGGAVTPGTDWKVLSTADLNADRSNDIVLQNSSTGEIAFWQTDGTVPTAGKVVKPGSGWQPQFYGDLNGDRKDDIVLRNTITGGVAFWMMNGLEVQSGWTAENVSLDWQIAGLGNFDGNGTKDLLWRNRKSGELAIWLLNSTGTGFGDRQLITLNGQTYNSGTSWTIAGIGDFNNDGKQDILYRSEQQAVVEVLLMNGTTIASKASIPGVAGTWQVQGIMNRAVKSQPFDISGRTPTGDYSATTAFDLGSMNGKGTYTDSVQPGFADYYKFNVSVASNVTLGVAQTGVTLQLFAVKSDGTLGNAIGISTEQLLTAGSYVVKVSTTSQASLPYTLSVSGAPQSTDILGMLFSAPAALALNPTTTDQNGTVTSTKNVISAKFKIKNNGSTTIRNVDVGFLLSRDNQIQPGLNQDVALMLDSASGTGSSTYILTSDLAPGATSDEITVQLRLPDTQNGFWYVDGNYTIGMVIDPANNFSETAANKANNFNVGLGVDKSTLGITQTETLDLLGSNIQMTGGTSAPGQTVQVSFTVTNQGNKAFPSDTSLPIQFFLSTNTTLDSTDAALVVGDTNTDMTKAFVKTYYIDPVNGAVAIGSKGSATASRTVQLQLNLPKQTDWSGWGTGKTFYLLSSIAPDGASLGEIDVTNNMIDPTLVGTSTDTLGKNYLKLTI